PYPTLFRSRRLRPHRAVCPRDAIPYGECGQFRRRPELGALEGLHRHQRGALHLRRLPPPGAPLQLRARPRRERRGARRAHAVPAWAWARARPHPSLEGPREPLPRPLPEVSGERRVAAVRRAFRRAIAYVPNVRRHDGLAAFLRDVGQHLRMTELSGVREKSPLDVVSDLDFWAEEQITGYLKRHYPSDAVLSEETATHVEYADRIWVLDPLDGTVNRTSEIPYFAISLALLEHG